MQQNEPACKIPYLALISEFLSDFRELHSRLDIIDRFGGDCLTDITDIPQSKSDALSESRQRVPTKKYFNSRNQMKGGAFSMLSFMKGDL
jgi:hypothetical protein